MGTYPAVCAAENVVRQVQANSDDPLTLFYLLGDEFETSKL